ncbi:hypothetical protein [Mesobacterium hydrothermale]|nr:hypothetical protein [Mesobacterium sp. TK19101]
MEGKSRGRSFDDAPVVLSQVQTKYGSEFVTMRQNNASLTGFDVTMQEEQATNMGSHATETLGWIAIEAGSGSIDTFEWTAAHASGIDHTTGTIALDGSVTDVVGSVSTYFGNDPGWARGLGLSGSSLSVQVQEDTSADAEVIHAAEKVDYFAFNSSSVVYGYDDDLFV